MLLNFIMKNFKSFYDKACFTMLADTKKQEYKESLIPITSLKRGGPKVVPTMVIYGSNASGKTTIINGINVLKQIVINGTIKKQIGNSTINNLEIDSFLHEMDKYNEPIHLEITFKTENNIYNYSLELLANIFKNNKREILREELNLVTYKNVGTSVQEIKSNIFLRTDSSVKINTEEKILSLLEKSEDFKIELNALEQIFSKNLDSEDLFLTTGFKSMISLKIELEIINWFQDKLITILDFANRELKINFEDENENNDALISNKYLDRLLKLADFGPQKIGYKKNSNDGNYFLSSVYEMKSNNNNNNYEYNKIISNAHATESKGTLKLIDFWVPFIAFFKKGAVFVLDEFDSSIHPELILGIINLFNNPEINTNNSQLIFNTHNPLYLNKIYLRRDQLMFVEKDKSTYISKLYRLSDYNIRPDLDYMKNYFEGKFGALPFIDFESALSNEEEGTQN